jgi:hypothetical protein
MEDKFVRVIGNRKNMIVFQFFLKSPYSDYSLAEIHRGVKCLSYVTVRNGFRALISTKIIKKSRQVGRARLYRLNEQSDVTIGLRMVARALKRRG